jgi:carbonic anhydrase
MKKMLRLALPLFVAVGLLAPLAGIAGCSTDKSAGLASAIDRSEQQAITPDRGIARLADGNKRFVNGEGHHRDLTAQRLATASGQYPFAVVLACIDSRSTPEIVFDQGVGDIFTARIAGNYSTPDLLGSMEFATKIAGAQLIVVMGHTECGAVKGACDDVKLGNLTTVIQAIRPAVESVVEYRGEPNSANKQFVLAVTDANVRRTVEQIRENSEILRDLERSGQIKVVGAMHDIKTGRVEFID